MRRIAIVGNSHVGALRLGVDEIRADLPDGLEIKFFAAPNGVFEKLELKHGREFGLHVSEAVDPEAVEITKQINGACTIDLQGFDHVILAGRSYRMAPILKLLSKVDVDDVRETGRPHAISDPVFSAFLSERAEKADPGAEWHNWSGARVWQVIRPRMSEEVLATRRDYAPLKEDPAGLAETLSRVEDLTVRKLSSCGITAIRQPAETIGETGLTSRDFSRGSQGLLWGREHPNSDFFHMNNDYGRLQMQAILSTVCTLEPVHG